MPDVLVSRRRLRRLVAAAALAIGWAIAAPSGANAQTVVVFVNGEPITSLDVDQRVKLTEVSTHKAPSRQEALNELIDEKLKVQIGKRYGLEIPDKDIESSFGAMAKRANQTSKQFAEGLTHAGINVSALKRRIKADMTWSSIIRGKFPSVNAVGERDVLTAMESRKVDEKDAVSYQYTVREILFIVPRGSPPATFEARRRQADELRHRFESCEQGVPFARAHRRGGARAGSPHLDRYRDGPARGARCDGGRSFDAAGADPARRRNDRGVRERKGHRRHHRHGADARSRGGGAL
jgi:peptidyl-prolyl cis-trans isomerase SurA